MNQKSSANSVSISLLKQMASYVSRLNIDLREVLHSVGISPNILSLTEGRISSEDYSRIQNEIVKITKDQYFGLHMGEITEPGSWSVLGYILLNCATIGGSLYKYEEYSKIIGTYLKAHISRFSGKIKISFIETGTMTSASRHCSDAALSALAHMLNRLAGKRLFPIEVLFSYNKPDSVIEYGRIFSAPISFSSGENALLYDSSIESIPIVLANPSLLNHLEEYAEKHIMGVERQGKFSTLVSRSIIDSIGKDLLTVEAVAFKFSISPRTLQHKLKTENTDFSTLLRKIRKELSKKYLSEHQTIDEISYLLGFAEPSIFRKAFKKWTGQTPGQYMKEIEK